MNSYRYVSIIVCQSLLVEINGFLVFSSVGGQFCHFCTDPVKRQIILTNIIDSTLEKQERYKPSLTAPLYNSHLLLSRWTVYTFTVSPYTSTRRAFIRGGGRHLSRGRLSNFFPNRGLSWSFLYFIVCSIMHRYRRSLQQADFKFLVLKLASIL